MRKFMLIILSVLTLQTLRSQSYQFHGGMTKEVLESYLSRSITMQGLLASGLSYSHEYNPSFRSQDIGMLADINARFIGRVTGLWGTESYIPNGYFSHAATFIDDITAAYAAKGLVAPICQAAIFEAVSENVNTIAIPSYILNEYNISPRNFSYQAMLYDNNKYHNHWGTHSGVERSIPDITKTETQMWYYYLATQYIYAGYEALHMGQVHRTGENDTGFTAWNALLNKIRNYASHNAKRELVLLDAHTHGIKIGNDLLFDFHSTPTKMIEEQGTPDFVSCTGNIKHTIITDENRGKNRDYIYNASLGGRNPLGWFTDANPYLVEVDNYGNYYANFHLTEDNHNFWFIWGKDEITWFRLQPNCYKNEWLKYAYSKVKCIDPAAFFQVPGKRSDYRAYNGQQQVIADIWNEATPLPKQWVREDFTDQHVVNAQTQGNAAKDLIYAGPDRAYYISDDKRIHGYFRYNSNWYTVSPSWAAHGNGQDIQQQVKAAGDLTVNPSGTFLYYRGVDGYIYRYQIHNNTVYTYSAMPTNSAMQQQNIVAEGSLICVDDERLFYIAKETANGNKKRIHALINYSGTWTTGSPSWAAGNINNQTEAAHSLVANPTGNKLYYVGTDGYIYTFDIINKWTYNYASMPTNTAMQQQQITANASLICPSDNELYYIANEASNSNAKRIHGIKHTGSYWTTISPSWYAHSFNGQSINNQTQAKQKLVCADDRKYLVYLGTDNEIHGFTLNNNSYSYINFPSTPSNKKPSSSFTFNSNNELHYIANTAGDEKLHYYAFQRNYCLNSFVQQMEPETCCFRMAEANTNSENQIHAVKKTELLVYPNPNSGNTTTLKLTGVQHTEKFAIRIIDMTGKVCLETQATITANSEALITLDTAHLENGIYMIETSSDTSHHYHSLSIAK